MRKSLLPVCLSLVCSMLSFAGVQVSAPQNGAKVATSVQFVATATTSCAKGVSAVGIYSAPYVLKFVQAGSKLNTNLNLSPGTYNTVVQEWDNCGGSSSTPVKLTVGSGGIPTGVHVVTPGNNATVSAPTHYVASASTSCPKGIAAMGVYTAPNQLAVKQNGANLDINLNLSPGTYNTVVQAWDHCGGSSTTPVTVTVAGGGGAPGIHVTTPSNNATVSSPVHYVASASSSCSKGIAAMGIYTGSNILAFSNNGITLDTNLNLSPGTYNTVVQEWDHCGGSAKTPLTITVSGSGGGPSGNPNAKTFYNLHRQKNQWTGYGLLKPAYAICPNCSPKGPEVSWWMNPGVASPSVSGNATQTSIGGSTPYSDVLWNNHLIGDFSSQGLPDFSKKLAPSLHDFTYDVDFFVPNIQTSQALEFDINQFVNGQSFIWGHECRIAGGHQWDTWDNRRQVWVPSGVACNPVSNAWNHLSIHVQRTSDNHLLFNSITLNGQTAVLNRYDSPTPTNWYGVTINYQIDGNFAQQPYNVFLDNLNFTYF
ncbi:MAG: hypothetical protein QOD84_2389 [Acidobacteriaceae bacterium]|jgi:hypothetical protein